MSNKFQLSMTAQEVEEALLSTQSEVSKIDFSNFDTGEDEGSFIKIVNGKEIVHKVYYGIVNGVRCPIRIDNCEIVWGDS